MPNRLLLADEDLKTSRVLEVSLRGAGFEVTTVTSGAAAWVAIEQQLPEVIIAAIDLAVIDGFELCARVRAREGGREVAFIFLGDDDSLAHRIKGIEVGADDYLLKPPYVQEVVARVRSLVQRRDRQSLTSSARAAEAFAGRLSDLSVVDLLQIIDSSRRSGIVHLHGARESRATIYFRQGHVVDAEVGRLSGVNAISRLFSWTEGTFEVEWKPIRRPNAIGLPTPELVLEGMKRLDERNRLAGALPDLNDVFEVNYRVLAERLSEIPDEVNAVLRLFDGARTLAHVVEDCQLPDLEAMAIAIRLREEGIIHNVSPPGPTEKATPPVGPRSSSPPPGADDVTVVRRITAVGIGSNPVQQSFAERLGATASAPTTVDAPAPEPRPIDAGDDDEPTPPPHHAKTDPGLGRPLDPLEREVTVPASEAIPESPRDESDGPRVVPSSPADPATTRSLGPGSDIQRRLTEPVAPLGSSLDAALAPETATPREADPSTLRTQRGIGPFPELLNARAAAAMPSVHEEAGAAPPIVSPEAAPPPAALSTPAARAGAVAVEMDAEATAPSARAATPPPMVSLEHDISGAGVGASPAAPPEEAPPEVPRVAEPARPSAGPEKTMRMNFPDEEFSAQDALDELGVPGWKRGARIVAAVVATGALAAVLVHQFRGGATGSIKQAASADRAPAPEHPAAVAPVVVAQAPGPAPAPVPKAPDVTPAPPPPSQAAAPQGAPAAPSPGATTPSAAPAEKIAEKVAAAAPAAAAEKPSSPGVEKPKPPQAPEARPRNGVAETGPAGDAKPAASESPTPAAPPADFARQLASCRSQFLRSRIRDAAVTCAAAVDANPNSADALTMMAHVELNRGRLAHANELAEKSIAIDPNQADAYVIIGGVHQDSGRNAQAKVAYRRYLQLAPHGRYAEELRSIVGSL